MRFENELQQLWPLNEQDREAKIAQLARKYKLRLRYYAQGLCAIFDKDPARCSRSSTGRDGKRKSLKGGRRSRHYDALIGFWVEKDGDNSMRALDAKQDACADFETLSRRSGAGSRFS